MENFVRRSQLDITNFRTWFISIIILAVITGCQSSGTPNIIADEKHLPTQVEGTSDRTIIAIEKDFKNKGVTTISVGQDYLISIPAIALFSEQSPRLTWQSYNLLNEVACYLRQFRHIGVTVTGYTVPYVSHHREHVLSLARAAAVANYLRSQDIETRFIFTEGMGNDKPIVAHAHRGDRSPNSRIEITFREIIA